MHARAPRKLAVTRYHVGLASTGSRYARLALLSMTRI